MAVACSSPPLLSSSSCSTATLDAQCSLSDLNHDHPRPVFPAGPQPRPSPPSVPCRTSTTTIHAQCSLPDLNREYPRQVFPAGPHVGRYGTKNVQKNVRTCHTACSYRVASLRNKHLALKTKEQEMKQRWQPKILVIQDEISLVPAAVENMMLYRSMRARQDEGLDPASYFHPGELMGHIPILTDCR